MTAHIQPGQQNEKTAFKRFDWPGREAGANEASEGGRFVFPGCQSGTRCALRPAFCVGLAEIRTVPRNGPGTVLTRPPARHGAYRPALPQRQDFHGLRDRQEASRG